MNVAVAAPPGAAYDREMPTLAAALAPEEAQRQFEERLGRLAGTGGRLRVREIRVVRYKPGRRCLIEYRLEVERADAPPEEVSLLGKVRARRFGKSGLRLLRAFREAGFGPDAEDGICVPEPVGHIPKFRMWLQRKVPGRAATELLAEPEGAELARRIAEAAHKVHGAGVSPERSHSMADELRILRERLPLTLEEHPQWEERIMRLLEACEQLGATVPEPEPAGIHRDFYADQVIVDGDRLHLIDFDLYCAGDPALDVGNFLGHVAEQSLRRLGDPGALADVESALEERFLELSGEERRPAVRAYRTLTLARHVHLSTLFPKRRPFTGNLLELCEELLGARC